MPELVSKLYAKAAGDVAGVVSLVLALKARADRVSGPDDSAVQGIKSELSQLLSGLSKTHAVEVVREMGVIRTPSSKTEAVEFIGRKVLERVRAMQAIAY